MDLKELNHAGEAAIFGSLTVLGDIDNKAIKTVRRDVNLIQNTQFKINSKIDTYWNELSADGIITPTEKIALKKEWEGINQTFTALYTQASQKQLLNTPYWIDYQDTYYELKDYLFVTEAIFDFMEATTELKDKTAFDSYFNSYYYAQSFIQLALTTGIIDKLGLRALQNLEEEGTNGELAFYRGELYQYDNGVWVKVNTRDYLGIVNTDTSSLWSATEGQYLLTGTTPFYITDHLIVNDSELIINDEPLELQYGETVRGKILYREGGVWKVAAEDDPRYVAVLADYLTVTGQLPALFISEIQELIPEVEPGEKYLGVFTTAPQNPAKNNYFLYSGVTVGDWVKDRLYMWDGTSWVYLDPDDDGVSLFYMTALQDILTLESEGDGFFSNIFCNAFFANKASLNALKVHTITLYDTGAIESSNYQYSPQRTGLRIDASGNIDANGDTHIGGTCTIDGTTTIGGGVAVVGDASFTGRTVIGGDALFSGDIKAGPLELLSVAPSPRTDTYAVGTLVDQHELDYLQGGTGTYQGYTFNTIYITLDATGLDWRRWILRLYIDGTYGPIYSETWQGPMQPTKYQLQATLTYSWTIASDTKTFKLKNLPTSLPAESGIVYRDGNYLKIS